MDYYFVELVKANGMKSYYGKNADEVFPKYGVLKSDDLRNAFQTEEECEKARSFTESKMKGMGILITESRIFKAKNN